MQFTDSEIDSIFSIPPESEQIQILRRKLARRVLSDVAPSAHDIKRKHRKRIRSRERDRLYTIIHKGETLAQLRVQAMEAALRPRT